MLKRKNLSISIILTLVLVLTFSLGSIAAEKLTIMATSDMHQYVMPYDYMANKPNEKVGFSKVYTVIQQIRNDNENTLLLSNGDFIQGSLLGLHEYQINPIKEGETQTIIKAYNKAGYDAASVGNHELQDYPMDFFEKAKAGADFPFVSANIFMDGNEDENYIDPYVILNKKINGKDIKIGVVSFIPPQSMRWGKDNLEGNVVIKDIIPTAKEIIPEVASKSDIVVVIGHTGISNAPVDSYDARENAAKYLAQIDGVDALITGHHHNVFPEDYKDIEGVNTKESTLYGVPTVMPGSWGTSVGVIDLNLAQENGEWKVTGFNVRNEPITENTKSNPDIEKLAKKRHEATIAYVETPIGESEIDITSYLARVQDSTVTQIVNDAQLWWAKKTFETGEFASIPILSAAAPFQAGREDAKYFTEVWKGDITIGDVTDIYIYDNEISVMHFNGKQVIEWLERSAENYNQIDPNLSKEQELLNPEFSAYNYDVIEGIEYEIDVTKPVGKRLVNATYNDKPLTEDMEFLVVTNNYRAGGGGDFPPCVEEDPVYAPSGVTNRQVIIDYIQTKGTINPKPTYNWKLTSFKPKGTVTFRSHPEAMDYIEGLGIKGIKRLRTDENGMGVYKLDVTM
ncbi:MAG: bifunctional 2',3'-cyclic-nucleotide 2'-phosphodiesterase/3'-nucleotidase [Halanaerobiales bacterium]|nr:bifunctional 2',3'-cyclic-nucleotide 2'-phosphodiesterase/3'-nucleotidase [Halanaerobiales bacterium]